jgi:hypothetical protein
VHNSFYLRSFAVGLAVAFSSVAFAQSYNVGVIQLPSGSMNVGMSGINNSGQVTGTAYFGTIGRVFIATTSGSTLLPLPAGWSLSQGNAINNLGQVAGSVNNGSTTTQAAIFMTSGSTLIPVPAGWNYSFGAAINDSGQVSGSGEFTGALQPLQAFIGTASGITPIPGPPVGGGSPQASSINNSGQVGGSIDIGGDSQQGFIGTPAGSELIPFPSGWMTAEVLGINDSGQVAGYGGSASYITQAFIGTASAVTVIPLPPGTVGQAAVGPGCLSNSGTVVGWIVGSVLPAGGWIWDASNGTRLLNSMVPAGWNIISAISISQNGRILAQGSYDGGAIEYLELDQGVAATVTANTGTTPQIATLGTVFATALAVTVRDAGGDPVVGVNVTFTAPGGGLGTAGGLFSNSSIMVMVATDASGVASAPFTADDVAGGPYVVTASVTGIPPVNFELTNTTDVVGATPTLVSPANGAMGVSRTASLNWNAESAATSYDVYFGNSSLPPFVVNTTATTYSPGTLLAGTTYNWYVVARYDSATAFSLGWSFNTAPVALQFYSITPCRIADTRASQPFMDAFGPPSLLAYTDRTFPILSSACSIPSTAQAYSLNFTVVPDGPLGFLSVWPAGSSYPGVSTLNSSDGSTIANAAIVPAGASGGITVLASNPTDLIIDINGYFAPASAASASLDFYPLTPCRIADTRSTQPFTGQFGPPSLAGTGSRNFPLAASPCLSGSAQAYSLNMTVVPPAPLSYLSVWPQGDPYPGVSTLNSPDGTTLANAELVPAGSGGGITVAAGNPTDLIIDINGTFAAATPSGLQLYTVTPCRVADTRSSQPFTDPFGPPSLTANTYRNFPIQSSPCGIPATAKAYALNMTVVPQGPLGFLSVWPAGQPYPGVSTLNSPDGTVLANAAIVPAGTGGAITVFPSNPTDLIIDIVGYFAP